MKKILAMALALVMTCGVMTACGDEKEDEKKTSTTTAAKDADKDAEGDGEEGDGEDEDAPVSIDQVSETIQHYDEATVTFDADSDISWIFMMNESSGGLYPGDEGYEGGEALLELSVEELDGIPMLKIDQVPPADGSIKSVKLKFDMDALFEGQDEKLDSVFEVKADLIAVAKDEVANDDGDMLLVPAWNGGAFGTNNNSAWNGNMQEWAIDEWISEWGYCELSIRPGATTDNANSQKFDSTFETNYLAFQDWSCKHDVDLYLADLVFYDDDGNVITLD